MAEVNQVGTRERLQNESPIADEPSPAYQAPPRRGAAFWMFPLTRIVFFLLIFVAFAMILSGVVTAGVKLAGGIPTPAKSVMNILLQGVVTGIPAILALAAVGRFIERRTAQQFGLAAPTLGRGLGDFGVGVALGAALMGATIGVFALAGWYRVVSTPDFTFIALPFLATVAGLFFSALFEEILFRAVLFRVVEEKWGTYIAVGVSAVLFGLIHSGNKNASVTSSVFIAIEAGLLLAATYALTRNVWLVTGLHWAWNVMQGPVFGAPVSGLDGFPRLLNTRVSGPALWTGGAFGPEAGLVACLLATATGVALLLYLRRRPGGVIAPGSRRRRAAVPA